MPSINRRSFLKGVVGAGALAALGGASGASASPGRPSRAPNGRKLEVSAWVWQFDADGDPVSIRREASSRDMRVIIKTHDGTTWMSRWDENRASVSGAAQLRRLRAFFGLQNVALDAWCVPKGRDPIAEAQMAAEVLDSGVERLYLDLEEGHDGQFWHGTGQDALRYGQELRRLKPNAKLIVAPDSRPWQLDSVPIQEFALFCDEIAPQSYWKLFNSRANFERLAEYGYPTGPEGVTPELMLDVTLATFERYGRRVSPIGDGEASASDWARFIRGAEERRVGSVSVWRFGLPAADVWNSIATPQEPSENPLVRVARSLFDAG